MTSAPTSFAEWQTYPPTLGPIHVAWLKQAKQVKTDVSATKKIALVHSY